MYLFFGTDAGLVNERRTNLTRHYLDGSNDPFELLQLTGDAVASDPLRLVDEANSASLFGAKRVIAIEVGTKQFISTLEILLKLPPERCLILLEAGALKRDAALRVLLESAKTAAAIECHPDNAESIGDLIVKSLGVSGLTISEAAKQALVNALGADRLTTRSEIAKLILYVHGKTSVEIDDVEAIVADAAALALDSAVAAAFSADIGVADGTAARILTSGADANMLLGGLLRYALALHKAKLDMESGTSLDQAVQIMSRQGLYPRKNMLEKQLRLWSSATLANAIHQISDTIGKARRETGTAGILATRMIWTLSKIAARN